MSDKVNHPEHYTSHPSGIEEEERREEREKQEVEENRIPMEEEIARRDRKAELGDPRR